MPLLRGLAIQGRKTVPPQLCSIWLCTQRCLSSQSCLLQSGPWGEAVGWTSPSPSGVPGRAPLPPSARMRPSCISSARCTSVCPGGLSCPPSTRGQPRPGGGGNGGLTGPQRSSEGLGPDVSENQRFSGQRKVQGDYSRRWVWIQWLITASSRGRWGFAGGCVGGQTREKHPGSRGMLDCSIVAEGPGLPLPPPGSGFCSLRAGERKRG